jgi:hypothetical protein
MRYTIGFVLLAAAPVFAQQQQRQQSVERSLPAFFIPNAGQADPGIRYMVETPGLSAGFGPTSAVFQLGRTMLRVAFAGANPNAAIEGEDRLHAAANFLIGHRRQEWKTNLPVYQKIP